MKVFLSYRRADSQATAGRIAQFLDHVPAVDKVFLDVDDIQLGEHFEHRIGATLAEATHAFVLIGSQWPGPVTASGQPRLFDADDPVRYEVERALGGSARVVPILLDGTPMPRANQLPTALAPLSKLNAFALRTASFDEDMDNLLDVLLGNKPGRGSRWHRAPLTPSGIVLRALGGMAAGGVALVAAAVANRLLTDCYDLICTIKESLGVQADNDALGLLWLIALATLAIAAVLPFAPRWRKRWR